MGSGIYGRAEAGGKQILFGSVLPEDEEEYIENPDHYQTGCDPDYRDRKLHAVHHRFPACQGRGNAGGYAALYTVNVEDMHPILGESSLNGFYLANGFSGHGFKLAPAIGSMMAKVIFNQSLPGDTKVDANILSINREPIKLQTKNVLA